MKLDDSLDTSQSVDTGAEKEQTLLRQGKTLFITDPFMKQIVNSLDTAVIIINETNEILSWNTGAEQLFGYSEDEIVTQNMDLLLAPAEREDQFPVHDVQQTTASDILKVEKWFTRKDGTLFPGNYSALPLRDSEGNIKGFARIIHDLTQTRQLEEEKKILFQELELEKHKLGNIFEQAPAFIAILRGENHIFEMVNTAYYQLIGHRDVTGKPVIEALPEVRGQGFIELLNSVFSTGKPFVGKEMRIELQRVPDGEVEERYANFVYEPIKNPQNITIGIIAHGYDVTDQVIARKDAEHLALQLKQQTQAFNITLSALKDFVYTFDTSGRFTYANNPLLELLGIRLEEIIGKTFHQLPYSRELATLLQSQIEYVARTGQAVTDETSFTSPGGIEGYYEYIFVPIFDNENTVILVAGSTRDTTTRKHLEQQKDEFMSVVSHELKTPVTSIKAFTQVLQNRFLRAEDEKSTALLGKMDAQINKLTGLIGDLLDVTKIEGGKLQFNEAPFNFDEQVKEIVEEVQRITTRHVIEYSGPTGLTIFGDRDRIGQVISNMLTNAIKYSPHSHIILVRSTADQGKGEVTLCVQDFGIGIPKERQAQVFERFYRVSGNDTIPGIGLGLYISAEIIKRQRGKIWVESENDEGSTFCFSLPIQKIQTE